MTTFTFAVAMTVAVVVTVLFGNRNNNGVFSSKGTFWFS